MNEKPEPGWNSSTMCLQVLHHNMTEQGWALYHREFPRFDFEVRLELDLELPRRPLDLGVGLWR
jgi:hypothetical protein